MVGKLRPSDPTGHRPGDPASEMVLEATGGDVRELQRKLWVAARRSPGRRFHALFDRVFRSDVLKQAWRRVQRNKGAAGVDSKTLAAVEEYGAERLLGELRQWLRAGVMEEGVLRRSVAGTPQGGVLSNIYLHALDLAFADGAHGRLVRYADDFVVMCRSVEQAHAAQKLARKMLADLGLQLHREKTRVVDLADGREGVDFLGCHFHARVSGPLLERGIRRYYLQRWPAQEAMKRLGQRIKAGMSWDASVACCASATDATCVPARRPFGRASGSRPTASTVFVAPSATRQQRCDHHEDHRKAVCGKTARTD
jgi:hypothetical protein